MEVYSTDIIHSSSISDIDYISIQCNQRVSKIDTIVKEWFDWKSEITSMTSNLVKQMLNENDITIMTSNLVKQMLNENESQKINFIKNVAIKQVEQELKKWKLIIDKLEVNTNSTISQEDILKIKLMKRDFESMKITCSYIQNTQLRHSEDINTLQKKVEKLMFETSRNENEFNQYKLNVSKEINEIYTILEELQSKSQNKNQISGIQKQIDSLLDCAKRANIDELREGYKAVNEINTRLYQLETNMKNVDLCGLEKKITNLVNSQIQKVQLDYERKIDNVYSFIKSNHESETNNIQKIMNQNKESILLLIKQNFDGVKKIQNDHVDSIQKTIERFNIEDIRRHIDDIRHIIINLANNEDLEILKKFFEERIITEFKTHKEENTSLFNKKFEQVVKMNKILEENQIEHTKSKQSLEQLRMSIIDLTNQFVSITTRMNKTDNVIVKINNVEKHAKEMEQRIIDLEQKASISCNTELLKRLEIIANETTNEINNLKNQISKINTSNSNEIESMFSMIENNILEPDTNDIFGDIQSRLRNEIEVRARSELEFNDKFESIKKMLNCSDVNVNSIKQELKKITDVLRDKINKDEIEGELTRRFQEEIESRLRVLKFNQDVHIKEYINWKDTVINEQFENWKKLNAIVQNQQEAINKITSVSWKEQIENLWKKTQHHVNEHISDVKDKIKNLEQSVNTLEDSYNFIKEELNIHELRQKDLENKLSSMANTCVRFDNDNIYIGNVQSSEKDKFSAKIANIYANAPAIVDSPMMVFCDSKGQLGTNTSSGKYKENIDNIGTTSSIIHRLRPVSFTYKTDENKNIQYGLIGEEVETIFPELVCYNKQDEIVGISYHKLIPLLLNEVKMLKKELDIIKIK